MSTQTYNAVITSNPSYSAKMYKSRLPYAILAPALGGIGLILCFFLLPWFNLSLSQDSPKVANASALMNVPGTTIADNGISMSVFVVANDGSGGQTVNDSFIFPLLWAIPVIGLIQLVLALLVLKDRLLPYWLSLSIRLSFAVAFIFELIYLFASFIGAFSHAKGAGAHFGTFPGSGLWVSFLVTIVTAIVALAVLPGLSWYWSLARNDQARGVRMSELRASQASRKSGASA